jgi:hypothetical protein
MKKYIFLLFGMMFGFILSRAGATTYDFYASFSFKTCSFLWVISTAASVGIIGVALLKALKARSILDAAVVF